MRAFSPTRPAVLALLALLLCGAEASPPGGLPEALKGLARTRKARFAGAWGGYQLRASGPVLAVSADGLRAATAGPGSPPRLWELSSGRQVRLFEAHDGATSLAFSPDGHRLAGGAPDGTISVWDAESGRLLRAFRRHQGEVTSLAFSPDGRRLASGGEDGTVRLWSLGQGRGLLLAGHGDVVRALAFFEEGGRLASASDDGTVRVWDLAKGRVARVIGSAGAAEAVALAVAPGGERLLVGREGGAVQLAEVGSGSVREIGAAARVLAVAFAAGGEQAVAAVSGARELRPLGARDSGPARVELRAWSASGGAALPLLGELDERARAVAFSKDGRIAVASGAGLAVWNLASGERPRRTQGHTAAIEAVVASPDGRRALTGAADSTARLWDVASGKEVAAFSGHAPVVRALAFSPGGGRALVGDAMGLIRLWDLDAGAPVVSVGPHRGVVAVAFAEEGRLASASLERIAVWDASGKEIGSSWFPRLATAVALSADGRVALADELGDGPRVREVSGGRVLCSLARPGRTVRSLALSRDGARAALVSGPAAGGGPEALELWDAREGRMVLVGRAPPGLRLLAFSSDGKLLLGAGADNALRLYVVKSLREADRFELHANGEAPTAADFAPDGLSFLVGTSVGALQHYLLVADPQR